MVAIRGVYADEKFDPYRPGRMWPIAVEGEVVKDCGNFLLVKTRNYFTTISKVDLETGRFRVETGVIH